MGSIVSIKFSFLVFVNVYFPKYGAQFVKLSIHYISDIPDSTVATIVALKQRGVLQKEIIAQVGCSPSTVSKVLCREGSNVAIVAVSDQQHREVAADFPPPP